METKVRYDITSLTHRTKVEKGLTFRHKEGHIEVVDYVYLETSMDLLRGVKRKEKRLKSVHNG